MEEAPDAVERVTLPRSSMRAVSLGAPLPAHIAAMPINIKFPGQHEATLSSLVQTLSAVNLQVAFQWTNPSQGEEILQRKLPFLGFQGSVGELMAALRTGLGVVSWYENGLIYISNQERYAVALPQNKDVLDAVQKEIESLGATNIVTSLRGGKIIYSAAPTNQDQVIGPFLERLSRNLAVVNLQVAVVSLNLSDETKQGFDWNAFSVAFGSSPSAIKDMTTSKSKKTGDDGEETEEEGEPGDAIGAAAKLATSGLTLSKTNLGNVFGTYGALSVAGALNFLSNFGTTTITQNVSMKTLSGSTVKLQSGQEIPYVSGVSNTSTGENTVGSTQTEKVETGLTIEMDPYYDSDAELVTVEVDVKLDSVIEFVELEAGNEIGSLTQPIVQKQNMNDIVRVQAGRTVVIGGLQYDEHAEKNAEPAFLRKTLEGTGKTTGSRNRDVKRNALFIILRPTLTVYETEN